MTEHSTPFSCCGCGVDLHEPAEKFYDDNLPLCRECHERYIAKKKAEQDIREMLKPGRATAGRPAYRMRLGDYESLREGWVQGKLGRDSTLAELAIQAGETCTERPYFDPSPSGYIAAYFKKREASVAMKHQLQVTTEALRRTFDEEAARSGVEIDGDDAGR
jgi:hypothetical protein